MSGTVVVDGSVSQSAGATGPWRAARRPRRCGGALRHLDERRRHRRPRLGRAPERVHGADRLPRRLRRCGRCARRLDLRGASLCARGGRGAWRRLHREGDARTSTSSRFAICSCARRSATSTRQTSDGTARRGSSTTSRSTTQERIDERRLAARTPRVGPLRPQRDRRDPARRARRHLRHPRLRGETKAAAFRRPPVPRRERLQIPARGLPRAVRHERHARHAVREEAARAEDPDHDRGHELRRPVRAREGGARPRRHRDGHLDHDRRRRHDGRGARPFRDPRLPAAAVALRDEPGRPAPGGCDRGGRRPGREARRRRHAPRPQDLRPGGRDARPAERYRPAQRVPASRLDGPRRPRDQDRRAARDHRLAEADLRQGRRHAHLLRRAARGESGCGCDRRRRHAGRDGGDPGRLHRARRHPDALRRSRSPCRRCRSSGCTAWCS